jgi:hypothetical protein
MREKLAALSQTIETEARRLGLEFVNGPGNDPLEFAILQEPSVGAVQGVTRGNYGFAVREKS